MIQQRIESVNAATAQVFRDLAGAAAAAPGGAERDAAWRELLAHGLDPVLAERARKLEIWRPVTERLSINHVGWLVSALKALGGDGLVVRSGPAGAEVWRRNPPKLIAMRQDVDGDLQGYAGPRKKRDVEHARERKNERKREAWAKLSDEERREKRAQWRRGQAKLAGGEEVDQ